jgi:hypothetical protein
MRAALIATLAAALAFAGCDNAGDSGDDVIEDSTSAKKPLSDDSLQIDPPEASIKIGGYQTFTATSGNSKVAWTIDGETSTGTVIASNGKLHIAENEGAETITVTAYLKTDTSKKGTAAVTIGDAAETPLPADAIIISPASVPIKIGAYQQFEATYGNSDVSSDVDWTIEDELISDTIIDSAGYLHIAENETAATLTVAASLKTDPSKKGTAAVTITPPFSNSTGSSGSVIDTIKAAKAANENSVTITLAPGTEKVDLSSASTDISGGLKLSSNNSPANVIIDGGGREIQMTGKTSASQGTLITVDQGVTLTLKKITLVGLKTGQNDSTVDNNASLIKVDGGNLILEDGGVIMGNKKVADNPYPGGVCVISGTFTMNGGKITQNSGGSGAGVLVADSTFEMHGGEISKNSADTYGGGVSVYNTISKFIMTGGVIYGSDAPGSLANTANASASLYVKPVGGTATVMGKSQDSTNNTLGDAEFYFEFEF